MPYTVLVGQFPRLPDELEDGDEAGQAHARQEDDEEPAHVCQGELVRLVHAIIVLLLIEKEEREDYC